MSNEYAPWDHVPAGWELKPLLAVATERQTSNRGMTEVNLLSLSYGRIVRRDINGVEGLLPSSYETYQIVEPGDVVCRFTDLQNDKRSLRTGLVTERGIITSAYTTIVPRCSPRWISYLFRAYDYQKVFYRFGGGVRQSLNFADVKRLPILLPPMGEQRAIADFLDRETAQIDAMVDAQERLVALLEERRSSLVDELLLRPNESSRAATTLPWLPYVPADVQLIALKRLLVGIDQGVSPQASSNPAGPGEWGVLTAGCVNGGQFSDQKQKRLDDDFVVNPRHIVHVGDLIVSRASGSRKLVGSTGMVEQKRFDLILSDKTFRLRVRSGTSERFLYWFMNSNIYRHQVEQAISGAEGLANNLPLSALRNFWVVLPRPDEQARIARHLDRDVSKIDAMISKAQESIALMKERRAALISAAVTGRIDVRTGSEHVERELEEAMA